MTARAFELLQHVIGTGDEADDVLRGTVTALVVEPAISWAGIAFVENDELHLGPAAGIANEAARQRVPILFEDAVVAELWVDGEVEREQLGRIATLIAPYALIGWDTGGETWDP